MKKIIEINNGNIVSPKGFCASGIACGLKNGNKKDLALIVSENIANTAMVTTQNVIKAAPVIWNIKNLNKNPRTKAIIINAGYANACTGDKGHQHVKITAKKLSETLGCEPSKVLVCSTGVIGVALPIEKIEDNIEDLVKHLDITSVAGFSAADAILTTDLKRKTIAVEFEIDGKKAKIGGMAKGSGMICPNMATMLSYITTDVNISTDCLQKLLNEVVEDTYNMMSVDGDMSTNDSVIVLANGEIKNTLITEENISSKEFKIFKEAFCYVNEFLAKSIIRDGEGASKLIEVNVKGAKIPQEAKKLAKAVINSNLVKTAFFGEDANWGRVISAMGATGVDFEFEKTDLSFCSEMGELVLINKGKLIVFNESYAKKVLSANEIYINVNINAGASHAKAWGCDLSYDYVKINGDYRS